MATLSSLLVDVLGRLEESNPPVFWSLTGEVYPQMVNALFESALITGVVQANTQLVTLTANTTYFTTPKGMVAPLRMKAPYPIRKTTLNSLDMMIPKWQTVAPADQVLSWFPLGVSGFGIYPQLSAGTDVFMDFIQSPVNEYRPYTGNEIIPFQAEFQDTLSKYAGAILRAKEGGAESEEAAVVFQSYMEEVKELSLFQQRIDSLVFSGGFGGRGAVNPRTAV